jgi:hypothetical protein
VIHPTVKTRGFSHRVVIKTLEENGCEESDEYIDIYNKEYHVREYKFCSMEEVEVR